MKTYMELQKKLITKKYCLFNHNIYLRFPFMYRAQGEKVELAQKMV